MKERKRWGKKFKDNRDWVKYNEQIVVIADCNDN